MDSGFWRGFAALLILLGRFAPAVGISGEAAAACAKVSAVDSFLPASRDSCSAAESPVDGFEMVGVIEGDEAALQRALNLVYKNREEYVAILFHASWCPFSKICRPNFNIMSSMFPTIGHFAFEESVIRPSILSRYGVHGFPTLFLLNSTMRVRYHGSRTISSLVSFYSDVTGIKPASVGSTSVDKVLDSSNLPEIEETPEQENCPFSWARSPEKLLQQDTYLALASAFVLLRLLYHLVPKLNARVTRAWRRHMQYASLLNLWDHFQANLQEAKQGLNMLNPCKRSNLQKRAMNAKAWASKSLATVSIGEPSTSRAQSTN